MAIIAAIAAALLAAPAAHAVATTYVVNDPGDAPDLDTTDGACDTDAGTLGNQCTLRAAIQQANANVGTDTITFSGAGQAPLPLAGFNGTNPLDPTCCEITDPVTIDGGSGTTVTFDSGAAGPLLKSSGANTTIKNIQFTGGASGPVLSLAGTGAKLDLVTVHDTPGTAILVSGSSATLTSVSVQKPGGNGISVSGGSAVLTTPVVRDSGATAVSISGSGATVSSPDIAGAHGDGISINGNNAHVTGGQVRSNTGNGIAIGGQGNILSKVVLWANGGKPISLAPNANGAILPPQNLRIGPRRADGSLPLTGSTSGGGIELWAGSPFGTVAPSYLDAFSVGGGDFTYNFPAEPPPGATFALTLTGVGTSEFATVTVPDDITSPDIVRARALSTTDVRVIPSEPLDPSTVQPQDFTLTMAGQDRAVSAATPAPDGTSVTLTSSGWKAGEAGYVQLSAAGALNDFAGNTNTGVTRLRVAAAPGDFIAPIAGQLAITPRTICLTHGRGCSRTGMTIKFVTTEPGKATIVVQRGNKRIGKRIYGNVTAGVNSLRFNGLLGGRKLRAGRYRLLVYVQDQVGNVTDQPPISLFSVRRVTK
jgi:CSLREA domain-containing protein